MADDLNYAVTVNSEGKLSYPENFISTNNIAQFGNDVSGILKDLTLDGVSKVRIYDKKTKTWTDTYNYVYLAQTEDGVVALAVSDNYPVNAWKIKGSNGKTYDNIQTAIDEVEAAGGGEVWIAAGTYKNGAPLTMKNNVAIYGGFAGTETSKDQRVEGNETILDGEGKYRVFNNDYTKDNPLTNSAKLDNVTIQNASGGGMYNYYASPEITNCTFTGNSAKYGGGMYNNENSSPMLTNCTFSGNSASSDGGGMCNWYSSPVLTNCTFSNNSATGNYSYGGGMANYGTSARPVLTNCTFSGNSASRDGGGMHNRDSWSPTLTNCILWGNTASSRGNEIYNNDSTTTIDTCIIKGGYSDGGTNIITADPLLQPLADNGGYVETCAVAEGSSAIGAGKVVEGVTTDARGVARSSTPTIGAYEYTN